MTDYWFLGGSVVLLSFSIAYHALTRPNLSKELAIMAALDDSITALTTAVTANTAETATATAAITAGAVTPEQLAAIAAQTTQVEANTTALTNALTPAA